MLRQLADEFVAVGVAYGHVDLLVRDEGAGADKWTKKWQARMGARACQEPTCNEIGGL